MGNKQGGSAQPSGGGSKAAASSPKMTSESHRLPAPDTATDSEVATRTRSASAVSEDGGGAPGNV